MDFGLKDKVALVAAASRGLGRAVAEELAAEGASLVLCARDAATLAETTASIADQSGAHVLGVPTDVTYRHPRHECRWTTSRPFLPVKPGAMGTGRAIDALQRRSPRT